MKIKILIISILIISLYSCKSNKDFNNGIAIDWVSNLNDDFSFKEEWNYPEGVYINQFGQLSCDGICPERTYKMKDEKGKIYSDSLMAYYQLIDTTHIYHSIKSDVKMYEYNETNLIGVDKMNNVIRFFTLNNSSTHSSLIFEIINDNCYPKVDYYSIKRDSLITFNCDFGEIHIDKSEWNNGVLKAKFDFKFKNEIDKNKPLNWKGLIYKTIDE